MLLLILLAVFGNVSCAGKEPEGDPVIYDGDGMERLKDDFPEWARATYVEESDPLWTAQLDSDRLTLSYDGEEMASVNAFAVMVPEDPYERIGDAVMEKMTFDWPDSERGTCTVVSMSVTHGRLTLALIFGDGNVDMLSFEVPTEEEVTALPEGVTVRAVKLTRHLDYMEPCYSIRDEGDRIVLRMTSDELYWPDTDPEEEEYTDPQDMEEGFTLSADQWEKFCDAIVAYNVLSWDGFDGVREDDPELEMLDGDHSFRLIVLLSDGTLIRAKGEQTFPEHYDEVVTAILELAGSFEN